MEPVGLGLMSEEDVRHYFVQNGGMVRNTDIVNYFRHFLSNPTIRDEARAIFKTYVNKLATVKVENGEKFLVLKRQYFPPIDGNGNPRLPAGGGGGGAQPNSSSLPVSMSNSNYGQQGAQGYGGASNLNMQQYGGVYPQQVMGRQNSQQSVAYGSQYSLNSNYMDPYQSGNINSTPNFYPASHYAQPTPQQLYSHQRAQPSQYLPVPNNVNLQSQQYYGQQQDYPPEYGLPTLGVNPMTSSPKKFGSPQNQYGNGGSPSSRFIPPPYRPPPPAGRFPTTPPGSSTGLSRRSSMTSITGGSVAYNRTQSVPGSGSAPYYASGQNINGGMDGPGMFPYHRSASVTGLPQAVSNSSGIPTGDSAKYFEAIGLGAPPPPVPPRSRRSVERSPSAVNSYSSIGIPRHSSRGHTTKMEMNGDSVNSQSGSGGTIPIRQGADAAGMMDDEHEKENINNLQIGDNSNHVLEDGRQSTKAENINSEVEQKISVKERMQKFNRIASEITELTTGGLNAKASARNRREMAIKHESGDFDTASLSSLDPKSKEWMMTAMKCDYPVLNKMAQENPGLVRKRDMNTALHWAAKHGNLECVKLLAGAYKAEVNLKSNGGYTPLHLAAQFGRQEVYDVLIKAYNGDPHVRDHSGKKPMQYLIRQDTALSLDTFKRLKEKRRHVEQRGERDSSFLRIGSLNVKVKSTKDAFGYFLGKSTSSSTIDRTHKTWGSADNIPEIEETEKDKHMMPPPRNANAPRGKSSNSKRRQKRAAIKESKSDSDSDSAFGFGSDWTSPVRD